ncbi:MAG: hypothetical protein BJ554DRAFT_5584, partial [Olpidium bornovanus]
RDITADAAQCDDSGGGGVAIVAAAVFHTKARGCVPPGPSESREQGREIFAPSDYGAGVVCLSVVSVYAAALFANGASQAAETPERKNSPGDLSPPAAVHVLSLTVSGSHYTTPRHIAVAARRLAKDVAAAAAAAALRSRQSLVMGQAEYQRLTHRYDREGMARPGTRVPIFRAGPLSVPWPSPAGDITFFEEPFGRPASPASGPSFCRRGTKCRAFEYSQ